MNRDEHVAWAGERALAELDAGGPLAVVHAVASVSSDLRKHPDTAGHPAIVGLTELMVEQDLDADGVREFITGLR